eukprot:TRINITY_DN5602_c0_g1_i10.p1 TRINITY_DN5602_c0_g1~~TRINITY_DN5602_c0_g1_i10.p1  ORF type:complete len:441 (+),score=73.15 TRINITY_DN5602_c0_g1_i10:83-1405(+)
MADSSGVQRQEQGPAGTEDTSSVDAPQRTEAESGFHTPEPSAPEAADVPSGPEHSDNAVAESERKRPTATTEGGSSSSSCACASHAVPPSTSNAFEEELYLDDVSFCSSPFARIGDRLVVTGPPWGLRNLISSRTFVLVLMDPANPLRGVQLMAHTSWQFLEKVAKRLQEQMGDELQDPALYKTLRCDASAWRSLLDELSASPHGAPVVTGFPAELTAEATASATAAAAAAAASSSDAAPAQQPSTEEATAPPSGSVQADECPICFEEIRSQDAAMRCSGQGGVCHYFHAGCLQQWIRSARQSRAATCPICRGSLQFNGARLQDFLDGNASQTLNEEERSFFQELSDGLRGKDQWQDMSAMQKAAYAGGLVAAAGYGFATGYSNTFRHAPGHALTREILPQEHQLAQTIGWTVGLLVRFLREAMKDRDRGSDRDRDRRRS